MAENVSERRARLGLTQSELAEKCGLSLTMIQKIEYQSAWPSPETLHYLSHVLGCDEWELFRPLEDVPVEKTAAVVKPEPIDPKLLQAIERGVASVLEKSPSRVAEPSAEYEGLSEEKLRLINAIRRLDDGMCRQVFLMIEPMLASEDQDKSGAS